MIKEKKINKDLYPSKWNELITKYNYEEAFILYWKFCRSFCLEKYILRYGQEEGDKIFKEKISKRDYGVSLEKCIKKHGEVEGKIIYNNWKIKVSGSLKSFIIRYGEQDGVLRYNSFRQKCIVKKHIKEDKYSKYNNRNHNTRKEYYIEKYKCSENEAKEFLSKRQSTSKLSNFIDKYGEKEGKIKYQKCNISKSLTLDNFIKKYGDFYGEIKWRKYLELLKVVRSTKYFIDKYGEEKANEIISKRTPNLKNFVNKYGDTLGEEKYRNFLFKLCNRYCNSYSKISIKFFDEVYHGIKDNYVESDVYYKDNEYMFFINSEEFKVISVDFYIKSSNKVIEFYGNYWHRNPIYGYLDIESLSIRERDERRLLKLKDKFNCDILIVWESDYLHNPQQTLDKCINFITNG